MEWEMVHVKIYALMLLYIVKVTAITCFHNTAIQLYCKTTRLVKERHSGFINIKECVWQSLVNMLQGSLWSSQWRRCVMWPAFLEDLIMERGTRPHLMQMFRLGVDLCQCQTLESCEIHYISKRGQLHYERNLINPIKWFFLFRTWVRFYCNILFARLVRVLYYVNVFCLKMLLRSTTILPPVSHVTSLLIYIHFRRLVTSLRVTMTLICNPRFSFRCLHFNAISL